MHIFKLLLLSALLGSTTTFAAKDAQQSPVTIDEDVWAVFYDVPSRRFRNIRVNFVQRKFDVAATDPLTSARYLSIEADRAEEAISRRLHEVADRLTWIAENIDDENVSGADLDAQFGRAHWLLAQHYLSLARQSRDRASYRNSGLYLWATAHHLERAVLWSNARIDRKLHTTLESLRDLAVRMQDPKRAEKALGEKPIVRAEKLLSTLGRTIDRPVSLEIS